MRRTVVRMGSSLQVGQTLVGRTGITYRLQKVLYERKEKGTKNEDVMRRLWLAQYASPTLQLSCWAVLLTNHSSKNNFYVVKPVTTFQYGQAFRLQKDLLSSPFVRLPVDGNDANMALIFQHYNEDFLIFIQSGPVSRSQVKRILLDILKGVTACHSKDWVHCGNDFPSIICSTLDNWCEC